MKKLLFATAVAASAAAFAELPNAVGFEDGAYTINAGYFYFDGDSDSSSVTNVGVGNTFTDKRTAYFAGLSTPAPANESYLMLDTEGGTLWRSINTITSTTVGEDTTHGLGTAEAVAANGTYLDTLVQFTVTEDDAPETHAGDKLAIWLQATEGATNLMVKSKRYIVDVENSTLADEIVTNAIEVAGVEIQPGTWYRLTVKAIPNLLSTTDYGMICGFQIYIDNNIATNKLGATFNYAEFQTYEMVSSEMAGLMAQGAVFASLGALSDCSLQGVGFQGTGAVDEIVWTEENPFPAAPTVVDFVLTLDTTDAHVDTISITTNGAPVVFDSGTAQIPSNTVVTIEAAPTFTDSYVLDTLTVGGISMTEFPTNFTMEADTIVAITSVLPVLNPTVDGTTVEPANVFNTAITTKPIVYPTAPTLAGTAGVDQTITFNGVTVNVPTYYDATLAGTTVSLSLNTNAIPAIGEATVESEEKAAIEVGATTFTTTLTTTYTKLYYGLKTATTPNAAEWTVGTLTQGTGAAMQIQADKPTVSGDTASAGFFKLYVTDVPPVTP